MDGTKMYPVAHIGRLRMGTDGHGIRTLVAFQGCPLRCKYCINPFTWDGTREPKLMSAREIYESILIDRPYLLATNGGITFGGGEPLMQSEAIKEFSEINVDKFSLYIETSLNVPRKNLEQVIDVIDKYHVDIKTMDFSLYREYTGGDLQVAIDNLSYLLGKKSADDVIVRIPIIPGFNGPKEQEQAKEELTKRGVRHFDLFKYRETGATPRARETNA